MADRLLRLTQERIKELLHYDPETGVFTWLVDRRYAVKAGQRAGYLSASGYRQLKVDDCLCLEHRLAFLYMLGRIPPEQVDHINQVKSDNRWCNLREASHGQNVANRGYTRRKNQLPRGVKPTYGNRFEAWLNVKGKRRYLGSYDTAEQASEAYTREARIGHGEFFPG